MSGIFIDDASRSITIMIILGFLYGSFKFLHKISEKVHMFNRFLTYIIKMHFEYSAFIDIISLIYFVNIK